MCGSPFRSQSYKLTSRRPQLAPWTKLRKIEWNPDVVESVTEVWQLLALEYISFAHQPVKWEFGV
jgi:hypothetical protein